MEVVTAPVVQRDKNVTGRLNSARSLCFGVSVSQGTFAKADERYSRCIPPDTVEMSILIDKSPRGIAIAK